jgi:formaldehyde-activating enzyme involved in methanogenesis
VCAANSWYALGAMLLRQRQQKEAQAAFARALTINPGHVPATAVLRGEVPSTASGMDAAVGRAIVLARGNRHREAAQAYRDGLTQTSSNHAGWILPVEPFLNPLAHREIWESTLALVRMRAT